MGISNITIDSITDVETLELNPGGGGGPTPEEPVYPQWAGLEQEWSISEASANWGTALQKMDLQDGDLLIAICNVWGNVSANMAATQAGWTVLVDPVYNGLTTGVYYRIVNTATDPTTYNFTWSGSTDMNAALILVRGVDQADPFPDAVVRLTGSGLPVTCPDITTTIAGQMILNFGVHNVSNLTLDYGTATASNGNSNVPNCGRAVSPSPGWIPWSKISTKASGTGACSMFAAVLFQREAGFQDGAEWDWGGGSTWQSFAIAIKPAE